MPAAPLEIKEPERGLWPDTDHRGHLVLGRSAGDRLAVLGRNGMGKTTLLATLMGLTTRHGGEISDRRA